MVYKIVMVRHGESEWNQANLFCGWYDSNLSERGKLEARSAGLAIKNANIKFDKAYTSLLSRSQSTLAILLNECGQNGVPYESSWRLNERHYGGLTGLNKAETAARYGEAQVAIWRRSYDVPPPAMDIDHDYYDCIVKDPRYARDLTIQQFPMFESLKLTIERTLPFWNDVIIPDVRAGKQVIIVAHGNSLRGIVKHLDKLSDDQIMCLNLPTGIPFVYTLDENMEPVPNGSLQFLGNEETVRKAMENVANQAKGFYKN